MKVKKGDTVTVISGKDKSKTGKVMRVLLSQGRVVVEGMNLRTKHQKSKRAGQKGERIQLPQAIHASNIMLVCSSCGKSTRVSLRRGPAGERQRVCKKCQAVI